MSAPAGSSAYAQEDSVGGIAPNGLVDLAMVGAFGLIGAPFLLKGLYGGSAERRRKLLDRLELPADAFDSLGGWSADVGLLELITDHILRLKPATIVEFGSGVSTLVIAAALRRSGARYSSFISFEQNEEFRGHTSRLVESHGLRADVRHAPLTKAPAPWEGLWYDHGPLPRHIDLLLVDGPPWTVHPFTRGSAESLFSKLRIGGAVILDDAARPGERLVARRWRRNWPNFDFTLERVGSKGALVGRRLR